MGKCVPKSTHQGLVKFNPKLREGQAVSTVHPGADWGPQAPAFPAVSIKIRLSGPREGFLSLMLSHATVK